MAQISRPIQVAVVAIVLFLGVWLLALRPHSSGSGSGSGASTPAASQQPGTSSVYHGSAPGVEGLTKAIAKAHGAVSTSQQNAKQLEQKSAQASSAAAPHTTSPAPAAPAVSHASTPSAAPASRAATHTASAAAPAAKSAPAVHPARGVPARQSSVEHALAQNKVALILFYNSKAADDVAVRSQVEHVRGATAVFLAAPGDVSQFGTITRGVQVNQTPTLLVVNKSGQVYVITGYTDSYAIGQMVAEAQHKR